MSERLNAGNIGACWETAISMGRRKLTAVKLLQPITMQEDGLPDWIEKEKPVDLVTVKDSLDELRRAARL